MISNKASAPKNLWGNNKLIFSRQHFIWTFFELKPWGKAPRRLILNKEEKRSYRRELTKGPNQQLEREKKHEKAN
jgi:hypothetical protein